MRGLLLVVGYHALHTWLRGFNPFVVVLRGLVTTHFMRGYSRLTPLGLCGLVTTHFKYRYFVLLPLCICMVCFSQAFGVIYLLALP